MKIQFQCQFCLAKFIIQSQQQSARVITGRSIIQQCQSSTTSKWHGTGRASKYARPNICPNSKTLPLWICRGRINQILIIIIKQSFHFNFHFTRMIISRLFFGLARPALTSQLSAAFAYANQTRTYSNIRSKIQSSRNFGEFSQLLENKKSEINIIDICSSSKHISGLINLRERVDIKQVQNFISYIEKSDLAALNVRNLLNILVVFRNLKGKRIYLDQLQTLRSKVAAQVGTLIKQKNYREDEAHELSGAYFEFSKQRIYGEAKMVAEKLLAIMEEGIKSDRVIFNNSELSFIVLSLSLRPNPTNKQNRIRQIILDRLSKQSQVLPIEELVKVVSCFAKMQTYDFKNDQFSCIKQLVTKVSDRIEELDENQLIQLIRAKSSTKLPGYFDFLQKIRNNIFEAIDSEGKSQIDSDAIIKVLPLLASKTSLREEDKAKMFAFLEDFAKSCKNDNRKFSMKTLDLVTLPSFDLKGKQTFCKILEKYEFQVTINMMYYLALYRFNIDFLTKQLSQMPFDKLTKQYIYKLAFVSYRISKGQADILPVWEKLHAIIAEDFSSVEKFIDTLKFLSRSEIKIEEINEIILPQFNTLPNPFQGEQVTGAYPYYYTQFVLKCWKNRDVFQFLTKHEAKVRISDLVKISTHMIDDDQLSTSYSRPVISILAKRTNEIIDGKNTKQISSLINLVGKFNRMVIYSQIDSYSENSIFRILRNLQFKLQTLEQIKIDGLYYSVLEKYISRSGNNYNFEYTFKGFIKYLLNHINEMKRPRIQSQIIEEGLALDYVTKRHLENIDLDKLYLPYFSKTRAFQIKDPSFTPDLTRFTNNSLEIVLTNPNLQKYIEANYTAIIDKIKSIDANQAVYLASIFNIHKSVFSRKIMFELLNVIIEKLKNSNRCNVLGMFENALANNYFTFYQYKKIAQKVTEDFKKHLYSFSIESHAELIKFLITQPGSNDEEYYTKLVEFFEKKDDVSDSSLDLLYNRLSSTNFAFNQNQVKSVQRLIKYNIGSSLHFFCMVQQTIPQADRSKYVQQIVEKLIQNIEKEPEHKYNSIYINYIKKTYPTETANLNIPEDKVYIEKLSFKPNEEFINNLNRISGNSVGEVKIFGGDNYMVKIKENIIVFIGVKKLGCYHEHEFIKRVIISHEQKPINVVCASVGHQTASVIEFISKNCPNTFDEKQVAALLQELKDKKFNNKKKSESHQE